MISSSFHFLLCGPSFYFLLPTIKGWRVVSCLQETFQIEDGLRSHTPHGRDLSSAFALFKSLPGPAFEFKHGSKRAPPFGETGWRVMREGGARVQSFRFNHDASGAGFRSDAWDVWRGLGPERGSGASFWLAAWAVARGLDPKEAARELRPGTADA